MSIVKLSMCLAAVLVTAATALSTGGGSAAYASGAVPWTDTAVNGAIGLCDSSGHAIQGGSVNATPFVTRAVSTTAAPSPYNKAGRTATLYAFQPRQGEAPGDWSGDMLTSSTYYTNPAHPMAEATGGDLSLAGFISEFPPAWNGLLQLRLYLSAPNEPADSLSYAATAIKVTGSTWSVVSGGPAACTAGKAESIESEVLPKKDTKVHHTATPTAPATTGPTGSATKQPAAAAPSPGAGSDTGSLDADSSSSGSGGSSNIWELILIAVLAAAAGGAAVTWRGRHRSRSTT